VIDSGLGPVPAASEDMTSSQLSWVRASVSMIGFITFLFMLHVI
jgi:hypothetical protein